MGQIRSTVVFLVMILILTAGSRVLQSRPPDEAASWQRIHARLTVELKRLGLFPRDTASPFTGRLDGVFYVHELQRKVQVTLPVWAYKKNIPRGQNPKQVESAGSRAHEMDCITVGFQCVALTPSSSFQIHMAALEKSYRERERRPSNRAIMKKSGNIITSGTLQTTYQVTVQPQHYHHYRGQSIILTPLGSVPKLIGFLRTGGFMGSRSFTYRPVSEAVAPTRPERILGAFPVTLPHGKVLVVTAVTYGTTQERPEIPFPHESVIHQALTHAAALIGREFQQVPELVPQSDCAKQETLTRFLLRLREHRNHLVALDKDMDVLLRQARPDARFTAQFGQRIQREGRDWLQTLRGFKNAQTRRGLMEEYDLIADSLLSLNAASVKYQNLTGRLGVPLSRETARDNRNRVESILLNLARDSFAGRLESEGLRDILTSNSWAEAVEKVVHHSRRKLDEFLDRETDRIFGFGFHDSRSARRALQMQLRREIRRHVAKLIVKITSNELVIELLAAPVIRWITSDLIPRLKEALRTKGNLEARTARSLETFEQARRALHAFPCTARLSDVRQALARARGALDARTFLDRDLRKAQNAVLLGRLSEGAKALTTTIRFTTSRFLLDFPDYEKDLDFVILEAGNILQEIGGNIPATGDSNRLRQQQQRVYQQNQQQIPSPPPAEYRQYNETDQFIPALKATVTSLKFYEGGYEDVPVGRRRYGTVFPRSATRAVWWELNLNHPPSSAQIPFQVQGLYWEIRGAGNYRTQFNTAIPAGAGSSTYSTGYGWRNAGHWNPGLYRVDIYINGAKAAHAHFTISQ